MKYHIITRENCQYCVKAKELLNTHMIAYKEEVVGIDITRNEVFDMLNVDQDTKVTLPVIFIDEEYIGGYDQLLEYLANKVVDNG